MRSEKKQSLEGRGEMKEEGMKNDEEEERSRGWMRGGKIKKDEDGEVEFERGRDEGRERGWWKKG